jgi:hypothetical protein
MNIHIMSRLVSICQVLSEEKIKSKSSQTTDAKWEQYVTRSLYSSFRVVIHLDVPLFFGGGGSPTTWKRVIQLCDTNQVHNSDEGCNGHPRYWVPRRWLRYATWSCTHIPNIIDLSGKKNKLWSGQASLRRSRSGRKNQNKTICLPLET